MIAVAIETFIGPVSDEEENLSVVSLILVVTIGWPNLFHGNVFLMRTPLNISQNSLIL